MKVLNSIDWRKGRIAGVSLVALVAIAVLSAGALQAQMAENVGTPAPEAIASHGDSMYIILGEELIKVDADMEVQERTELGETLGSKLSASEAGVWLSTREEVTLYDHDLEEKESASVDEFPSEEKQEEAEKRREEAEDVGGAEEGGEEDAPEGDEGGEGGEEGGLEF
ncbi:MAG: hypothetical protein ACOCTQ_01435 [Planctomycetota bacterium]